MTATHSCWLFDHQPRTVGGLVKKCEEAQEEEVGRGSVQGLSLDDMILRKSGRRVSVQGQNV